MSFTKGPVFTATGRNLLARAIAGETLTFTKMQMGNGNRGSATIDGLTALVSPVASVSISALRRNGNFVIATGMFSNADITTGFEWNEIGLFAADPAAPDDRSRDILYCYQDAEGKPEYIAASDSELITKRISIAAIVSDATTVSATFAAVTAAIDVEFDNTATTLTAENVQQAIEELEYRMLTLPVGITVEEVKRIADASAGDAVAKHNTSTDAHQLLFNAKASKSELAEAEKRARALTAHNLLIDGGFEMGRDYWQNYNENYYSFDRSNDELLHGYYSLKLTTVTANSSSSNFFGPQQQLQAVNRLGHVIYICCMAKAATGLRPAIALGYGGANMSSFGVNVTASGSWQLISRRVSLAADTYPTNMYLGLAGTFAAGAVAYFEDAMVVDLTDVFGAGNEPTQAWCDANIKYFNTAAAVNEWQTLSLFKTLEATVTT